MTVHVLLSGYYGFGNLGDEALLEVIVGQVRRRFPQATLEVLSATPQTTAARYGVAATPRWDWRAVRAAVGRSDAVLSGGGGLLQNATSMRSLLYYAGILREAARKRRKTMVFAQSIGPLDFWGRLVVGQFCKGLDRATVRDERSRALLQSILPETPVERTADPVFLYDLPDSGVDLAGEGLGPESGPYAVISVRNAASPRDGIRIVARAVDRLTNRHGIRCAFLPMAGAADAAVSTDVIRACSSSAVLLPEMYARESRGDSARRARRRRHAAARAGAGGALRVPFLAIPYDPKVAALCEDLTYPLPPLWVPGEPAPSDEAIDAGVDRLIAERDAISAHLKDRADAVRAAAERNFDVLGQLL